MSFKCRWRVGGGSFECRWGVDDVAFVAWRVTSLSHGPAGCCSLQRELLEGGEDNGDESPHAFIPASSAKMPLPSSLLDNGGA